jgi:uncharacterized protein DUF2442
MIRILSAEPLSNSRLKVTFDDGLTGVFPVEPEGRGGVFLRLFDPGTVDAVSINPDFGCVEWPGGIDLCPDTMHQEMLRSSTENPHPAEAVLSEKSK